MQTRYEAAMVLSGAGDAIGFRKGDWEFCTDGVQIHKELEQLGGVNSICVSTDDWPVSDDTVMHIATAKALVKQIPGEEMEQLFMRLAKEYKECMNHMTGRAPGATCKNSSKLLQPETPGGYIIPFNRLGGGCGAAMRSMCIGLRYPRPEDLQELVCVSVESGRMTHHHPNGYLGALATALFTSYAIQDRPIVAWGRGLIETLPKALHYVQSANIQVSKNETAWEYFGSAWQKYLKLRGIEDGVSKPKFPKEYSVEERDDFYYSLRWNGMGRAGSSGHDAPMIAYDALLSCKNTWPDLCRRAMLHGGDSDSTGVIAGCLYGARFGFKGVKKQNYQNLEFRETLEDLARQLYRLSHPNEDVADVQRKCVIV